MNKYFFSLFFLAPLTCWGGAYKCEAPDGSIIFQQFPCADEEKQKRVEIRTIGSAEPEAVEPVDDYSINSQLRRMEEQLKMKQGGSIGERREGAERKIESLRRDAREKDPDLAAKKCAEAKAREQGILRSDPLAWGTRAVDLGELRGIQDIYCEEYKARNVNPTPWAPR